MGESEVDIIYQVLKSSVDRQGKSLRELLQQIFTTQGWPLDDHQRMASIHTQLTLDNRFICLGQGNWGLREWTQAKVVRRNLAYGAHNPPFHRRSLQNEIEGEEKELANKFDNTVKEGEDEWEED